jgi:hypothetical protein
MTIDNYKNRLKEVEDDVGSLKKLNASLSTEKQELQKKVQSLDSDKSKGNVIDLLGESELTANTGL